MSVVLAQLWQRPRQSIKFARDSRVKSKDFNMQYLHTMVRVSDLDASLDFFCGGLGLVEVRRMENEKGRFTLIFLATPQDAERIAQGAIESPVIELTHNWDEKGYAGGRNFGHLAYAVEDIYALCGKLMKAGVTINRPPRDGHMAFIRSPDGISIELLQQGDALPSCEPWASMPNSGSW
jgi:lactoylglutathione lyase